MQIATARPVGRLAAAALLATVGLAAPGCIHVTCGFDDSPDRFEVDGPGVIYATTGAWPRWNGNLIELGLLNEAERDGEFFSLDVWPLVGVGVGVVGARVRVLMLEIGAGTLFHDPLPLPSRYGWSEPEPKPAPAPEESKGKRAD